MKKRGNLRITFHLTTLAGKSNGFILLGVLLGFISELITILLVGLGTMGVIKYLGYDFSLDYTTIFVLVTCISMIRALLKFFEQYVDKFVSTKYITKVRSRLFEKLDDLSPALLENKNYGDLITTLTTDVSNIEMFYTEILSPIGTAVLIAFSMCLFILISHGFLLALVAAIGYFIIGFLIPVFSQNAIKKYAFDYQNTLADFNDYYLDSIQGCKDLIVSKNEENRKKMIEQKSIELSIASQKLSHRTSLVDATTTGISFLFIFLFIIVAAMIADENVLFLAVTVVCFFMSFKSVVKLNTLANAFAAMIASGNRILDIMEEKPLNVKVTKGSDFEFESLDINKVSFAYPNKEPVLKRLSLTVDKGDVIAIIGQSGNGKSTLFKLLMQNYLPTSGEILYNGISIDKINTKSIYTNVSLFSQQTYIFQDSIKNNLLIAKPDASNKEIMDACKKANVHEAIVALPRGYNTPIGEGNESLSLGEKQRIGLARVFLRGPKLLLLDEPTSNIDSINEKIIMDALMEGKEDMTILIISHRASTVAYANSVYKLKNGLFVKEK